MNRLIQRLQMFFFAAFLVVLGAIVYQRFFIQGPYQRCERIGAWYSPADHRCARVLYVPNITHRYVSDPRIPVFTGRRSAAPPAAAKATPRPADRPSA